MWQLKTNYKHMKHLIAPSILTADLLNLQAEIEMINSSQADWLHLDIMDGVFVPNITFGFPVIEQIALNNLKIYPNPASQFITISAPFGDKPYNLDIIDLSVKSLMNKQVSPNENIDVSALENGVYILRINYNEQFATTKLVISK